MTMNQVAEKTETGTAVKPFDKLRETLIQKKDSLEKVLPAHITFEKFHSVVMTACMTNPQLVVADRASLILSCVKSATDGLLPDSREAALVIFNAKLGYKDDSGRDVYGPKVQYMPMFAGLLKKARQSKEISNISTHVVYEKDKFEYLLGDEDKIIHTPYMGEDDRGKVVAAYCIAKLKDGSVYREVMTRADIEKVRKTSKSGAATETDVKYDKTNSLKVGDPKGIWRDWYEEMARKTVFRRAAKWLPQSVDKEGNAIRLFEHDDTMDSFDTPVDATYTKTDEDGVVLDDDGAPAQLEHIQEVQPDLKQAIAEKQAEAIPPAKEEKVPDSTPLKADDKATLFDIEQKIRKEVGAATTAQAVYDLATGPLAEDLERIKKEASGSYATLKSWIDSQIEKLGS
jgi:phage RecT family recombinase